ncbi:MAG TPA: DUF423 domain-containing protein [Vicinamibacterales bacterium]|jgi:uncharacterized membrane protein YgdD (TMEM256/DUF423 family)
MHRTFLLIGALSGVVGVTLGAFGAHGLRSRLSPDMLAVFETGVRYHMYHAVAILGVALIADRMPTSRLVLASGWLFLAGIVLFSGSLYLLATTGVRTLGAVTPFGGVAFLVAWACLAVAAIR